MKFLHYIGLDSYGGNRVYAEILNKAILDMGYESSLISEYSAIRRHLGSSADSHWKIIFHSYDNWNASDLSCLKCDRVEIIAFAHNPRIPKCHLNFDLIIPVSNYVRNSLLSSGLVIEDKVAPSFYIDSSRLLQYKKIPNQTEIRLSEATTEYIYNLKKFRDFWLFAKERFRRITSSQNKKDYSFHEVLNERVIHLAIVSRLARLKKFDILLDMLFSSLAEFHFARFRLHVIGSGPWRVVQDIKRSVPMGMKTRVHFWGWQPNTLGILPRFDALLMGMPEQEALGLNTIEATLLSVPVIAIRGGPFCETIEDGRNGWLLSKSKASSDFIGVLDQIEYCKSGRSIGPEFNMSDKYLKNFSSERFDGLVRKYIL